MMQKSKVLHRGRTKQMLNRTKPRSSTTVPQKKQLDLKLYQKFINFMSRTRLQKLKQRMSYFYGRNFPINYDNKYNFLQEWQGIERKEQKSLYQLIQSQNQIVQLISLVIMLTNTFIVWSLSVERVFKSEGETSQLYLFTVILGMINRIISLGLRLYLQRIGNQNGLSWKSIAQILIKDAINLLYFMVGIFSNLYYNPIMVILEMFLSLHLYSEAKKYYKYLRIIQLSLLYEYQFKIFDLMINLFIIAHILSIMLYAGTFYNKENNWIVAIKADQDSYLGKYLYSLYFCCTTILTIGYGDISPKNKLEIVIVIIVELFGVIIFGYLINQIGHTLSIIRKNEESLQKDLTVLKKIENFYDLESKLVNQAKGYLVANQNALVELTPQQEKNFLSKLNEQLRTVIINEKSLSIVKTSIFFLCRWSKDMQSHVASKLQKALYLPNERLLQPPSKERIYIIKRGKIDIYCDRFGHNRRQYRRLKTLKINAGVISQNVYGYTAVISSRPCALDAISSQFTSCYYIQKDAFIKSVNSCEVDLQYYHEIKCRIDQSEFCESYEAPSILNIREHYNPSRTILIRKTKALIGKLKNSRQVFVRCEKRRVKKHHFKDLAKIIEDINDKLITNSNDFIEFTVFNKHDGSEEGPIKQKKGSEKSIEEVVRQRHKKSLTFIPPTQNGQLNSLNIESRTDFLPSIMKKSIHHFFERAREYKNFFNSNNLSQVIRRLQNENYNFNKEEQPYYSIKVSTSNVFNFGFHRQVSS